MDIEDGLAMAGVAIPAFVSTNMDNLVLLTLLLGQRGQRRTAVLYGYVGAVTGVVTLGLVVARVADTVPDTLLGYLGLIPLAMGVYRLARVLRPSAEAGASQLVPTTVGVVEVGALTLSNGADTLGVLLPLFAESSEPETFVLAGTVPVAALLWFLLATWIAGRPWIRVRLGKVERWLVPLLLIGVGLYILLNSPTDTVVDEPTTSTGGSARPCHDELQIVCRKPA